MEKKICDHGCITPIITDQYGTVIDGHNRREICIKHGISYRREILAFKNKDEAKQWITMEIS